MAVTITDNQTVIIHGDTATNWSASSAYSGFQREGTACLGDQQGNGYSDMFYTAAIVDYRNSTIFGWCRSGNPHLEASHGFGIIIGAENIAVATQAVNAAGTGYAATDVLTVATGTGTAATITVDSIGGGGEVLTSTLTTAGSYSIAPSTPDTPTGGGGSGATFDLTFGGTGTTDVQTSYSVGGSDNWGCFVSGWGGFRLDTANLPTGLRDLIGTSPPVFDNVVEVGYSMGYNSKANGNADNVFWDQLKFIANGSPALSFAGGTVGVPSVFLDIAAADIATTATAAYGILRELVGAKAYEIFYGCEWGHATTDTYFDDSDFQLFVNGGGSGDAGMTAGNMDMSLLTGTGTNLFKWDNFVCVGVGTAANWDFSPAFETFELTNGSFTDAGAIAFPVTGGTSRKVEFVSFVNCGQVAPSTLPFTNNSFVGTTDANGALLISSTTNMSDITFTSDGTGYAIQISTAGTYNFTNFTYTSYGADATIDAVIQNDSGGLVTVNVIGGDTPTFNNVGGGSTTTVNNSVTVAVAGVSEGAACKIIANETVGTITIGDVILESLADSTGNASTSISYEGSFEPSGLDVITRVRSSGLPSAAIADDNGVFVNETTNANKAIASTMTLLPATPVVNQDAYILGHSEQFGKMKIDIPTAGTGGFTITWQYWNGAWTALTGVIDDTSSFSVAGLNYVSWTIPGDWATSTINTQGPFYYIRAIYTAGTVTVTPVGTRCSLDVTRYLPFNQSGIITSSGLTVTASWNEDKIATF